MLKEFKEFIARGNVVDLAVGMIVGSAFTAIVTSLVSNIINPLIGMFLGQINLSNLVLKIGSAEFKYGDFIDSIINFLIIAFVVFIFVKIINKVTLKNKKDEEAAPAEPSQTDKYLGEIVDLLKKDDK
ncbi:large-conductance mechanosensitive channel protein MscL [Lactobacillus sp. S2-2]|uniref:large-conductance mechanosensitive channel protein MscL n=1 Tax=Lactobacillus sp. S2-2 TaxID=2692917 RepID=UPI001F00ACAA|nr:large-conductance mechanosensitive channel protein MscL [Lactobacillus sp. S2-2]MCF6515620.1 large-conductance mechanosensitive channel protein MscL [Lactobacillus sp. S2-2]